MNTKPPIPSLENAPSLGMYKHYKGGLYELVDYAIYEETMQPMVVYKNAEGILWLRTIENWNSLVDVDGQQVQRFTLCV